MRNESCQNEPWQQSWWNKVLSLSLIDCRISKNLPNFNPERVVLKRGWKRTSQRLERVYEEVARFSQFRYTEKNLSLNMISGWHFFKPQIFGMPKYFRDNCHISFLVLEQYHQKAGEPITNYLAQKGQNDDIVTRFKLENVMCIRSK